MRKIVMVPAIAAASLTVAACGGEAATDATSDVAPITAEEVAAAQQGWGEGIVNIGKVYSEGGDFAAAATDHINTFYAYEDGNEILFKPTLAAEDQFRGTFDEALSYFIGTEGTEDGGFAIAPYTAVRWENEGTIIDEDSAMAMGNYYFTNTEGNETKVEYTFGYTRNEAGELVINLHHSSLPFSAEETLISEPAPRAGVWPPSRKDAAGVLFCFNSWDEQQAGYKARRSLRRR